MKTIFRIFTLILFTAACLAEAALQDQKDKIKLKKLNEKDKTAFLKNISRELENVKTMRADFTQERHMPVFKKPLISEGVCCFEKPHKLHWEISRPFRSIMIFNGEKAAKFEVKNGRLKKLKIPSGEILEKVLSQISSWMRGDFSSASGIYSINIFSSPGGLNFIVLVPKSERVRDIVKFISLKTRKKDLHVNEVVIFEKGTAGPEALGAFLDFTTENRKKNKAEFIKISFHNEKINETFPDAMFSTETPCFAENTGTKK